MNAVAANLPFDITEKEIPTNSSCAYIAVSAFATPDKPNKANDASTNNLSFFIKNSLLVSFFNFKL